MPAPPDSILFDIGPGVAPELAEAARMATGATVEFFFEKYGYDLSTVAVHIHADAEGFVDAMMAVWSAQGRYYDREQVLAQRSRWAGTSFDGHIFLRAKSSSGRDVAWLWGTVPHEATHLFQRSLGGFARIVSEGVPMWLTEGHAEYVAEQVQTTYSPELEIAERTRHLPAKRPEGPTLEAIASDDSPRVGPDRHDYELGLVAVDVLLSEDDDGIGAVRFWRAVGEELAWEAAFEQAFGLAPDDFYVRFEAARPP